MRLAILLTSLFGGGAEHVGRSWAREMAGRGHEVDVVLLERPTIEDVARVGGDLRITALGTTSVLSARRRLQAVLRRTEPDAVVSLQMAANLVNIATAVGARPGGPKVIISERNIVGLRIGFDPLRQRAKIGLARVLYRRADHMVAISHPVAAEMVTAFKVPPERCTVVPNPAAARAKIVPFSARPGNEVGSDLALVVVGRLVPQKQPMLAIDVARRLRESGTAARVVFVGDGPMRSQVQRHAQEQDVPVTFEGWVDSWASRAPHRAVLLHTAAKEGFGNVLVEAAANRIPSVACSSALGVADALVPGVTGHLVATRDPLSLARACLDAAELSMDGMDGWLDRFTPSRSATALEDVVRRVISGPVQ